MQPSAVRPRPMYNPATSRPTRDPLYLAWIRSLACVVCHRTRNIDAAHTGDHGISQKASDRRAIPLCRVHHDEYGRIGRRRFEQTHSLNIEALILKFNQKPRVVIRGGRFVAIFPNDGREEYVLRPVRDGTKTMLRTVISICRERFLLTV